MIDRVLMYLPFFRLDWTNRRTRIMNPVRDESRVRLTRSQILAFRRDAGALDERLPPGARSLRRAAWVGLQDSMPRAALLSIHARVEGAHPSIWEHESLVQLWGPRFSVYVVAARDRALFSLARLPDEARGRQRAEELAARLHAFLDGRRLTDREAGQGIRVGNRMRYATATGTILIRWEGARAPVIWTVPRPEVDPFDARRELARRYLHIFGPATPFRRERERLHHHWEQRLERATQEVQRAERQYHAVEPENRLAARSLERRWEEALRTQCALQEEYDRFLQDRPRQLSEDERSRIQALAGDIPSLWHSPQTSAADRKEIVRLLVERVVVHVRADSERGEVEIAWRGGLTTNHGIVRSVSRYESLSDYRQLLDRIGQLRQEGLTIVQVAKQLNQEGYRTPRSRKGYTSTSVRKLLSRQRHKAERRTEPARKKKATGG